MKKGLIICGYPGVGKSSVAGWNNCIDLESSFFTHSIPDGIERSWSWEDEWCPAYCEVAISLAKQGFIVLTSTHLAVLNYFAKHCPSLAIVFCPRFEMKEEWSKRLFERWLRTKDEKDLRAFEGAINYWDKKIDYAINCGLRAYAPDNIDYNLKDYILRIRELEGCNGDPKTYTPMEPMARVEESSLDVSVVEKDSDISEADS